jgi:branched-subunit amino acid aminotransferase/4-amino-4-deoxychorismate lyase
LKILLSDKHIEAPSTSLDRGVWAFTSLITNSKKYIFLNEHLERLYTGGCFLYPHLNFTELKKDLEIFLEEHFIPNSYYRLNLIDDQITVFIKAHQVKAKDLSLTRAVSIKSQSVIPAFLKVPNYLIADIEMREALKGGFDDILFFNLEGHVQEASTSNIFVICKSKTILTPPCSSMVLEGVFRKKLIQHLIKSGHKVDEVNMTEDDLLDSSEVLLTNSVQGLRRISQYKKIKYYNESKTYDGLCLTFGRFGEHFNE